MGVSFMTKLMRCICVWCHFVLVLTLTCAKTNNIIAPHTLLMGVLYTIVCYQLYLSRNVVFKYVHFVEIVKDFYTPLGMSRNSTLSDQMSDNGYVFADNPYECSDRCVQKCMKTFKKNIKICLVTSTNKV